MKFDPENPWFKKHLKLVQDCAKLVGDDFLVAMPDLMENMDVLASMRGTMDLLTDILTEPEMLEDCLTRLDELYYEYYDRFYDAIVQEGGNAYTVFQVWGPGKTTKVQCDLSSMFSTDSFRQFVVPYLRSQAKKADNVLFHLDGPDMIRHLDAVLEIDEIDVIQWVSGKTNPDGTFPQWDEIYEKTLRTGKSIFVYVDSGEFEDWIRNADRIVKKFGSHSLYLHFPEMSYEQDQYLLDYAEKNWSDVKGSFFE
jgi:5-methyltetrahydrofolate--homocysteine methyltransferase